MGNGERRIGILTSGGDCPGLNAIIRAAVHRAVLGHGWRVIGIEYSTLGLLARPVKARELRLEDVQGACIRMAGTMLGTTNRGDPFAYPTEDGEVADRSAEAVEGLKELKLDALIGIGGDGSQAILRRLAIQAGIPLIAVPKTIDNDVVNTDVAVGHLTAVDVATQALDNLQATAASHDRIMILEVMGRDAGHIALGAGIAGGADVVLIPEIPYRIESIADRLCAASANGRHFSLIVVAEGISAEDGSKITVEDNTGKPRYGGVGHYIAQRLRQSIDAEIRVTVLGYTQRGATPNASDRIMAAAFGTHAVDLIAEGRSDCMVVWRNRKAGEVPLDTVIGRSKLISRNDAMLHTARGLGIYFGED